MENKEGYHDQEEIYSNVVRAGKRTYFFDVRSTRNEDYYLTITESKKKFADDGTFEYRKHKIFLYKEDFEKFGSALSDSFKKIIELKNEKDREASDNMSSEISNLKFEDLDSEQS